MFLSKKNNGFTLNELLIVTLIVFILLGIAFANYKSGQSQLALQRTAYQLSQDIRRMQLMAGLSEERCKVAGFFPVDYQYGYGAFFDKDPLEKDKYILFADCDGNKTYDSAQDQELQIVDLARGVEIYDLETFNPGINVDQLDIVFVPPDPAVYINYGTGAKDIGVIGVRLEKDVSKNRRISVNKAGLINIE